MGREKKTAPGVGAGAHAKERHKRDRRGNVIDWTAPLPPGLVARPEQPRVSSKHKSWFEFIENKDKKKKLEFEFTEKTEPPPGFEFVPIGNPVLTTACKELSREQDAMIFIVTAASGPSKRLNYHLNRVGHHIRQSIVEQARATIGEDQLESIGTAPGMPEPIPERQEDINKQADAAIRDLFPRIPNTDRQVIIEHAFNKSRPIGKDGPPVGLATNLTLSRRVQLAVLAHIRHNHTRYDQLLKETTYVNARKAVESLCLDILVKWRGDEETGRDQLDEILCEVIVISDSESDESDDDEYEDECEGDPSASSSAAETPVDRIMGDERPASATMPPVDTRPAGRATSSARVEERPRATYSSHRISKTSTRDRRAAKWAQRGFSRYQAAWQQAVDRQRQAKDDELTHGGVVVMRSSDPGRPDPGRAAARRSMEPPYHADRSYAPPFSGAVPRGQESRVDERQKPVSRMPHHVSQLTGIPEGPAAHGLRPAVEDRAPPRGGPQIERVSYQGQDLKDYLVPSIEPASPESPNSRSYPVERPAGGVMQPGNHLVTTVEGLTAQPSHAAYADEGFIRLPPRSKPGRVFSVPEPRSEPFILLNREPARRAEVNGTALSSAGAGQRYTAWVDDAPARGPDRSTRPVWVEQDGLVRRSEARPIIISDNPSPPRPPRTDGPYVSPVNVYLPPEHRVDPRQRGPSWADQRHGRPDYPGIDQRLETLPGDFVEIVQVSNRFPKQHESRPIPHPTGHDSRPIALQQSAYQPHSSFAEHHARPIPGAGLQRVGPVPDRVGPRSSNENAPFVILPPGGSTRQERVVSVEYVHPRESVGASRYSERSPFYVARDPGYRSRSNSAVPVPHAGYPYQSHTGRPTPRRDEVILLE